MAKHLTSYKSYTIPIVLAITIEGLVLLVLFYNWSNKPDTKPTKKPIVATLYDSKPKDTVVPPEKKVPPEKNVSPEENKPSKDQDKLLDELLGGNVAPPSTDQLSNQIVGQIDDLVRQRIQENWIELGNPLTGSQVELLIEMTPNGTITNVLVNRASGNIAFDNSAVTAAKNVGKIPEVQKLDTNTYNQLYRKRAFIFTAKGL